MISDLPDTRALATASHSIAATLGYEDGENIPLDLMLDMVGRIVTATDLPVSADLEAGYGNAGETIRRAIGVGVVGANLEDQLRPFDDAVAAVRAAVAAAADAEGVPFALNARTDVFLRRRGSRRRREDRGGVRRGRAFLDEGATAVFVPGRLDERTVERLVGGLGERKLSVIAVPGSPRSGALAGAGRVAGLLRPVDAAGRADRAAGRGAGAVRRRRPPRGHRGAQLRRDRPRRERPA